MGAAPIFLVGMITLIALLMGTKKAGAKTLQPALPSPLPPGCSLEDKIFIGNVLMAAGKGMATKEMLVKAIKASQVCEMSMEQVALTKALLIIKDKEAETRETGIVKVTSVKATGENYVCGVLPGKGYACRPKKLEWKKKAKKFQNALNLAAYKLPGPAETPKLLKVDGVIGLKTDLLFKKVMARANIRAFAAFTSAAISPEKISVSLKFLTTELIKYAKGKGASVSGPVSPLPGVSMDSWIQFLRCMKGRGSPNGLGMFKMNPSRIKKLGITKFPEDRESQLKIFTDDIRSLAKSVLNTSYLKDSIGQSMNGEDVTLSGMLALCKQAGPKGAQSWLQNETDHKKFPNTTEAFQACNGIF